MNFFWFLHFCVWGYFVYEGYQASKQWDRLKRPVSVLGSNPLSGALFVGGIPVVNIIFLLWGFYDDYKFKAGN